MSLPCSDCAAGALHGGTPTGTTTTLHGLPTYVAEPSGTPKATVVIIADAFGWDLVNNRVLADSYASKGGFKVLMPDFFDGHWLASEFLYDAEEMLDKNKKAYSKVPSIFKVAAGFIPFLFHNRFSITGPRVYKFFAELRKENPGTKIFAAGFCWGGKWTTYLCSPSWTENSPTKGYWPAPGAKEGEYLIDAGYTAHPSLLDVPGDFEKVTLPLSVAHGTEDHNIKAPQAKQLKDIITSEKKAGEWVDYEGAKHGFAVRGDPKDEKVMKQGVEAEDQAIAWFTKHLS